MKLWKNCLAVALSAVAAAFVPASAQTQVQGVIQPAVPASQPAAHATPASPPASVPPQTTTPQPAEKSTEQPVEKPAHRRAHGLRHNAVPQPTGQPEPPILPAPTLQPAEQAAPTLQPYTPPAPSPYAQPAPTPQPYSPPAPAPQPYTQPTPAPRPYAQPAPTPQPYSPPTPAPQPYAQPVGQAAVTWTLQVIRDGQQIDSFDGTSAVGQARTDVHHQVVRHNVGCLDHPAGSIDLQRSITISPLRADATTAVLAIDARETVESDTTPQTPEGCKLPPRLSLVHASHPGLIVPAGQWVTWQIVGQDPLLLYRVRANLVPASAQP